MDYNSLEINLIVAFLTASMVFLLPWADRRVCRRLRLNLEGGLSDNPNADRLLQLRHRILSAGLVLYCAVIAWLVFFSRSASGSYTIHFAPLESLKNAFSTPTGFSGWFRTLFTQGFSVAFSQISIVRPEDISQFFLNTMLFVPLGYLLPYTYSWFRARVRVRPVLVCLLLSFLVENIQLISMRGMYDFDDIISNTLGAWIGQLLYLSLGYVLTHSGWRHDLREYHRWRRASRKTTLLPYVRKTDLFRTTLCGTDQAVVFHFFVNQLGFHMIQQLNRRESGEVVFLFELGKNQVQVICSFRNMLPEKQYLTLYACRLPAVRRRLAANGIDPGEYRRDPCTGRRVLRFAGPDRIQAEIIGEE